MSRTATEGTVRALAATAFERHPDAPAVAFRAERWEGKPSIAVNGGRTAEVHWCASVLEFRERLANATADQPVVLLTRASEDDIGIDALTLLAGQKLRLLGVWE